MKKIILAALLVFVTAVPAMAATSNLSITTLNQSDFKAFSEDFGMALSYQPLAAAAPLGDKLPGFDAGVEASYVKLDTSATYFQKIKTATEALGGTMPEALILPRVHVQVGLPIIPIDLGVSYTKAGDVKLVGYELKYAILSGTVATPAVAIRAAYTKLSGVDALDIDTKSLDLSISKGILIFTPYAGIGEVWIKSDPNTTLAPSLTSEKITKTKFFVGTKVKIFPFVNLVLEGDFANVNEYTGRLNINF